MKVLLSIIISTIGALGNLTLILVIVIYIFAVIGMQLFSKDYTPDKFYPDPVPRYICVYNKIIFDFNLIGYLAYCMSKGRITIGLWRHCNAINILLTKENASYLLFVMQSTDNVNTQYTLRCKIWQKGPCKHYVNAVILSDGLAPPAYFHIAFHDYLTYVYFYLSICQYYSVATPPNHTHFFVYTHIKYLMHLNL